MMVFLTVIEEPHRGGLSNLGLSSHKKKKSVTKFSIFPVVVTANHTTTVFFPHAFQYSPISRPFDAAYYELLTESQNNP